MFGEYIFETFARELERLCHAQTSRRGVVPHEQTNETSKPAIPFWRLVSLWYAGHASFAMGCIRQ